MASKYKSKLDKEKAKKKEMAEDLEYLRQVDAGPDKGRKFVAEYEEEKKKKEQKEVDDAKGGLEGTGRAEYKTRLAIYGAKKLEQLGFPEGWEYYCISTYGNSLMIFGTSYKTQDGILMILRSPKKKVYTRGIKVTGWPDYDVNAIDVLVMQAENTLDSEKGLLLSDNKDTKATLKKTESGIYY